MTHAISPLEGRYAAHVDPLRTFFSEFALMRERCFVEIAHVLAVDDLGTVFDKLSADELERCLTTKDQFDTNSYKRIKEIESEIRHDVKACEVYLRERLSLKNPNRIHFGLTSEDVNNLAYSRNAKGYVETIQLPEWKALGRTLVEFAERTKTVAFPSRTHGQHASPSTFGKELSVYVARLADAVRSLKSHSFRGKLNGATGTYAAALAAAPNVDWRAYEKSFVSSLGLEHSVATTQIDDHGSMCGFLDKTRALNLILEGLCQDMWLYISYGTVTQRVEKGEVGSSTMPHKVNPIHFENAEGNFQLSTALLEFLSAKLSRSRMQRDLSGSTVIRNVGVACGHHHLAMRELLRGLARVDVDRELCHRELTQHPELLTEPIQSILRTVRPDDVYTLLKELSRGESLSKAALVAFVEGLSVDENTKRKLSALDATSYIGDAVRVCDDVIRETAPVFS